jgi:hypothetical protein
MPVGLGEIGSCPQPFFTESIKNIFGDVGFGIAAEQASRISHFVIRQFCVEHAKSIVVLSREDHVPHPGITCSLCPFPGIKINRVEGIFQSFVFLLVRCIIIRFPSTPAFILRTYRP